MISLVGNFLLIVNILAHLGVFLLAGRGRRFCFYIGSLSPAIAFVVLVFGFVISDFGLRNVFLNSSTILPLIYRISASWASHEGSILLWLSLLCLVSFSYICFLSSKSHKSSQEFGMMVFAFIQILFTSFVLFTSNPFDSFSFVPTEGLGLNPMLQDVALSIHPPLLYLGYVSYVAIFAGGCLLLYKPEDQARILFLSKGFSSFALALLTIGIGLGSWWAYRELGWGGFWFFDPVENVSLMPWLSGIALHHFLIITCRNGRFLRLTIFLSLLSFILVIYGTFIVRSGIVSSVHSFAFSPERGLYIFIICTIITLLSGVWFGLRYKEVTLVGESVTKKETAILIGNMLWLAGLVSLVIAIIYPIYCSIINGIDIAIDPGYFTAVFIPIHIPIIFLAAISPYLGRKFGIRNLIFFLLAIIIVLFIAQKVEFGIVSALICVASVYLMIQMLGYLLLEPGAATSTVVTSKRYALFLGHFGFGMLAFSITLGTLLTKEVDFVGKIGDQINNNGMIIKLENVKFSENDNYFRQIAIFSVEDKDHNIVMLKPENRLYKVENTLSQEVDIHSFLFHDFYAVLGRIHKDTIHAQIHYKPWISFIWLAVFMMASGFAMLLKRR